MTRIATALRRPLVAVSAALVALAIGLLAGFATAAEPVASSSAEACPGSDTPSADSTARQLRKSIRCRINEERAIRGVGKVRKDDSLRKAATRHVNAMVETNCLAHKCPGEPSLDKRIKRSGYTDGADTWQYAENTGCALSADAMTASWMESRFHRVNLLDSDFDDVGVGVSQKSIKGRCGKGYAAFVVVLGHREP